MYLVTAGTAERPDASDRGVRVRPGGDDFGPAGVLLPPQPRANAWAAVELTALPAAGDSAADIGVRGLPGVRGERGLRCRAKARRDRDLAARPHRG